MILIDIPFIFEELSRDQATVGSVLRVAHTLLATLRLHSGSDCHMCDLHTFKHCKQLLYMMLSFSSHEYGDSDDANLQSLLYNL